MGEAPGPGARVAGYVIEREIGRGGMGVVYEAEQERLGRRVALKVISPELSRDDTFLRRFERESRLAASIEHPHAVPVHEAGESDGVVFIAMRLVSGSDLRALLAAEQWLEPERAVRLVDQVAGALDAAHALGLVHRDIKPANILVGDPGGASEWAYLTDFGLSRHMAEPSALTESGQWIGTLDYASPEQIRGERLDARSDVYSLGCVLYEALTGRIPFERPDDVAKLYAHANDPPPRPSELIEEPLPEMDNVIARAMAKDRDERFPSAGDLGRAARAALRGDEAPTRVERSVAAGAAAPARPGGRRRVALVAGLAGLALAAVVAVLVLALGDSQPEIVGTTEVGGDPFSVSAADGTAWVTNESDDTVTRIDGETGEVEGEPIRVGERPSGIRVGQGAVWVANSGADTVSRIDPGEGRVTRTIEVGRRPAGIRTGEGSVWVTNVGDGTVSRIDAASGEVTRTVTVGSSPSGVAVGEGAVWVANSSDGTVTRLATGSGMVVGRPIRVGARPRGLATGEGAVWVANSFDGSVSRIDPARASATETIPVGERPAQIAIGDGSVWVANQGSGTVSRIDPATGEAEEEIEVGAEPRGISFSDGVLWVVSTADETVSRIEP